MQILKCFIFYIVSKKLFIAEDSSDVDPNYDPSDFLMAGLPKKVEPEQDRDEGKIQDDLAVSESEDEGTNVNNSGQMMEEDDGGELWF